MDERLIKTYDYGKWKLQYFMGTRFIKCILLLLAINSLIASQNLFILSFDKELYDYRIKLHIYFLPLNEILCYRIFYTSKTPYYSRYRILV